jgi:hypothetical protein
MSVVTFENKDEKIAEKLICESCGAEFSCGAKVGKCWCFEVDLKVETLTELKENYNRCLCENCLRRERNL